MDTEVHRHACEVRSVLAMGDKKRMKSYMDLCEQRRGKACADRLRADVRAELIKLRESENGSGEKPGTRGATSTQQVHDQTGTGDTGEDRIQTEKAGKTARGKGKNRGGNKSTDQNGYEQTALL